MTRTVLAAGGTLAVASGAALSGLSAGAHASIQVLAGGAVTGDTLTGGTQDVFGQETATLIGRAGLDVVNGGGASLGDTVTSGGELDV